MYRRFEKEEMPLFDGHRRVKKSSCYRNIVLLAIASGTVWTTVASAQANGVNSTYVLGPGDQVSVRALHAAEMSDKPARLDEDGYIRLPLVGRIKAGGLTVEQLSGKIRERLDPIIRDPEVSIDLMELKSHPVSVLGAVKTPGVYQIQGKKRLLEVLSAAGGVDQEAGDSIRITRNRSVGPIPLPSARESAEFSVAEINLAELLEAKRPESNIIIFPQDVISVPRAKLVYVIGEVRKSGGFVLRERESISVLQALSMAEGLTVTAGSKNAKILRPVENAANKQEIAVNVKDILGGKAPDLELRPNDVLFIPNSASKNATLRAIESAIQMGTGMVIWRR
jgi:polysaccharide biosynthesis/export protein